MRISTDWRHIIDFPNFVSLCILWNGKIDHQKNCFNNSDSENWRIHILNTFVIACGAWDGTLRVRLIQLKLDVNVGRIQFHSHIRDWAGYCDAFNSISGDRLVLARFMIYTFYVWMWSIQYLAFYIFFWLCKRVTKYNIYCRENYRIFSNPFLFGVNLYVWVNFNHFWVFEIR